MGKCIFCRERTAARGCFALCEGCRRQAGGLSADAPEYMWYMRAVKRALFEEKQVRRTGVGGVYAGEIRVLPSGTSVPKSSIDGCILP